MKFGIRSRILVIAIILSVIFLLVARMLLRGIIINTYWEDRVQDVVTKVSVALNMAKFNNNSYKNGINQIKELKEKNELIEDIEIIENDVYEKELEKTTMKDEMEGGTISRVDVDIQGKIKEINLFFKLKSENTAIKMTLIEPDIILKEMAFNAVFKILSIFIILFNVIFALCMGKFITKKVVMINALSKEMVDRNLVVELERDIIPDEFDELKETLNEFTQNFTQDLRELERDRLYKKQLMLSLSHEIKTPIGGLNGILEGMLDNVPPYTDRDKYIRECRKLSSKLGNIANEMLDITKLNSIPTGKKEVILNVMIEEIWDELSVLSLRKNVDIINEVDNRITTFTDEVLFRRSIVNIIENAIKYAKEDTNILIKSKGYTINFYNECSGLTNDDLNFVFNPLYRGSNRESAKGRGIGLYIVKECLIALNISFKIENYEKGVVFRVNLKGEDLWG